MIGAPPARPWNPGPAGSVAPGGVGRPRVVGLVLGLAALAVAVVVLAGGEGGPTTTGPGQTGGTRAVTPPPRPSPLVDPDEIVDVLAPDTIPAIDEPRFLPVRRGTFLAPREPVLALVLGEEARAYPVRILMWHEIVNDVVGGVPVAVTYCPLCNTGIAFVRPVVDGELLDFGTSGKLYFSNLVMYDRQTGSLWPQVTGQAVAGPLTGMQLDFVGVQLLSWGDFRRAHPDGLVLSQRTGHQRPYGVNPYEYYDSREVPSLFAGELDDRLPATSRVLGVAVGDALMAFPYEELRARAVGDWAAVSSRVGGKTVLVLWKAGTASALDAPFIANGRDVGAAVAFFPVLEGRPLRFEARPDGLFDLETGSQWNILGEAVDGPLAGKRLERVLAIDSFWFDWAAFHPETGVFGLEP